MKLVRESLFEEEEFKWIKGPTPEQVRARLEPKLNGMTLGKKFYFAVKNGLVWLLQECINAGYDPSDGNNRAIRWASGNGHLEVVKELLKDKRVRDKLSPELKNKFKEFLK